AGRRGVMARGERWRAWLPESWDGRRRVSVALDVDGEGTWVLATLELEEPFRDYPIAVLRLRSYHSRGEVLRVSIAGGRITEFGLPELMEAFIEEYRRTMLTAPFAPKNAR
ncbi:MAG: hypothetical protein ACRDM7_12035, partial [Thermoleophilaceae bacterium]